MTAKVDPYITIIIVARNAIETLPECLTRIHSQTYCKSLIEILLVDGGSVDGTIDYAKKKNVKIINGGYPHNPEARKYIGAKQANGEILVYLDTDNFLPDKNWLSRMVFPFTRADVVCSFTKWYEASYSLSNFDRYYALLGGNDPVAYYLGKHDRVPLNSCILPYGAKLIHKEKNIEYVTFSHDKIPTLGANGFLVKKSYFDQLNYKFPEMFSHIDAHIDLLKKNKGALYAIVSTTLIHATGKTLLFNLKKRLLFKRTLSNSYRKYKVFDPQSKRDVLRLVLVIIRGLTIVEPLLVAFFNFYKTRRIEWLLHPVALFSMVCIYGYSVLTSIQDKR